VARLRVTVSPGASRTELVGRHGEGWRARVAAPPERGRANKALCTLLSDALGLPAGAVRVVGGAGSRSKVVEVDDLTDGEIDRRLASRLRS
jgi:hypothetical protein